MPRLSSWLVLSYTSCTTSDAPKPVPERPSSRQKGVSHGVHLDDEAERLMLMHLVLTTRQRGIVGDPGVEVGWYGQDDPACLDANVAVRQHRCTGFVPLHRTHGCVEEDVVTEGLRHADRYLLHSASITRLSRMKSSSTRWENEPAEAAMSTACRAENEAGLVSMPLGDEEADVVTGLGVVGLIDQPLLEGDCVEIAGEGMCPRLLGADLRCEIVHLVDETVHLLLGGLVRGEGIARVSSPLAC